MVATCYLTKNKSKNKNKRPVRVYFDIERLKVLKRTKNREIFQKRLANYI